MTSEENNSLKQAFTSLVDSMRFVRRLSELESQVLESKREQQNKLSSLDETTKKLSDVVLASGSIIGATYANELSKQISSFSYTAIELMKSRIIEESEKKIRERAEEVNSERTKALKSIEAFMAVSPFPVTEKVLTLKLQDSAYEARVKYRSDYKIEHEFSLDTNNYSFAKRFRLSGYQNEIRLPVRLGKNWLRRDPTPDFERLDQFYLADVEVTEKNLIANFVHEEEQRKARVVYSKQDTNSFLSVEYTNQSGEIINVTATPDLNVHFDSESLKKSMERLWLAIMELEKHKIALKKLHCENADVLDKLDTKVFFARAWQTIAPAISQAMKESKSSYKEPRPDIIDEQAVSERLKLLGSDSDQILAIISPKT